MEILKKKLEILKKKKIGNIENFLKILKKVVVCFFEK